jgi:L-ribulokinase
LLVDVDTGVEVATAVHEYPSGEHGILLDRRDPNLARQNPADYWTGFVAVTQAVLKGVNPNSIIGIGVDTTGSSPIPVDGRGWALSSQPKFSENLAAQCWLWKDHTAYAEAAEITELARKLGVPYLAKCGGAYSSEWFWSKILHCARTSPDVFDAAYSWVECCDFVVGFLTGNSNPKTMARSICAAGHKAMYSAEWGSLPSKEFLGALDSRLAQLRDRLYDRAVPSNVSAGGLLPAAAQASGLPEGIPVAVGAFDAHFGAVASGVKSGTLVKIMGTSTCDCMVHPLSEYLADIPGLCGIVPESILPDFYGLEAGQSAVGDIFNWVSSMSGKSHKELTSEAARLKPGESGLLALDWNNGNRTILVDPLLSGLLIGQSLHTTAGEIYRAAIESTAFGALKIIRRLEEFGVEVREIVNCGGIAEKSPLAMQIYADVCNRPMKLAGSSQTCALGAAIFGALVGGGYSSVEDAQSKMVSYRPETYVPDPASAKVYSQLYELYSEVHDAFGTKEWRGNLHRVMKDLIQIRERARGR